MTDQPGSVSVDFYYSVSSRYSYLASTQIAALERDSGCTMSWRPVYGIALYAKRGMNPFVGAPVSGQYDWDYRIRDAVRWADLYGVRYVEPGGHVEYDPATLAMAAVASRTFGKIVAYSHQLFAALFVDSIPRLDAEECVRRAEICGIAASDFRDAMASPETFAAAEVEIDRAVEAGVFGVPSFVVGGDLFWGNDRIVLLRQHLARAREGVN